MGALPGEASISIPKKEFVEKIRARALKVLDDVKLRLVSSDAAKQESMSVEEASSFLTGCRVMVNTVELENLLEHFATETLGYCNMAAFVDAMCQVPTMPMGTTFGSLGPPSPHKAHLALGGESHTDLGQMYKPFPKRWGEPPNVQLKGHDGIMRDLPGGYGRGNRPMERWVESNMEKDAKQGITEETAKPKFPLGNYSYGSAPVDNTPLPEPIGTYAARAPPGVIPAGTLPGAHYYM